MSSPNNKEPNGIWTISKQGRKPVTLSTAVTKEVARWIRESAKKQGVSPSFIISNILETIMNEKVVKVESQK